MHYGTRVLAFLAVLVYASTARELIDLGSEVNSYTLKDVQKPTDTYIMNVPSDFTLNLRSLSIHGELYIGFKDNFPDNVKLIFNSLTIRSGGLMIDNLGNHADINFSSFDVHGNVRFGAIGSYAKLAFSSLTVGGVVGGNGDISATCYDVSLGTMCTSTDVIGSVNWGSQKVSCCPKAPTLPKAVPAKQASPAIPAKDDSTSTSGSTNAPNNVDTEFNWWVVVLVGSVVVVAVAGGFLYRRHKLKARHVQPTEEVPKEIVVSPLSAEVCNVDAVGDAEDEVDGVPPPNRSPMAAVASIARTISNSSFDMRERLRSSSQEMQPLQVIDAEKDDECAVKKNGRFTPHSPHFC